MKHILCCVYLQALLMDIQSASSVVLQALTQATSQDTAVLKPAEEQLRQWETQPGFYSVLLVKAALNIAVEGAQFTLKHHFCIFTWL